jgi:hypothetical protein
MIEESKKIKLIIKGPSFEENGIKMGYEFN